MPALISEAEFTERFPWLDYEEFSQRSLKRQQTYLGMVINQPKAETKVGIMETEPE